MELSSPLVSVLMPAYNVEEYIGEAIQSVLRQTLTDWELVIVDDGSTDGTLDVVRSFSDPRIRLIQHERNLGVAAARNRLLLEAKGDYATWLDADDMYTRRRLSVLWAHASTGWPAVVADDLLMFRTAEADSRVSYAHSLLRFHSVPSTLCQSTRGDASFVLSVEDFIGLALGFLQPLFRMSLVHQHDLRFEDGVNFSEDFNFGVKLLCAAGGVRIVPSRLYYYRLGRPGSATGRQDYEGAIISATRVILDHHVGSSRLQRNLRWRLQLLSHSCEYRSLSADLRRLRLKEAVAAVGRCPVVSTLVLMRLLLRLKMHLRGFLYLLGL